jgi:hypothetical protein
MKEVRVLGIRITDTVSGAARVQHVLTKYGCSIRTRLGLHDPEGAGNSSTGLILLELTGDPQEHILLENELLSLKGVITRKMEFPAPDAE